MRFAISLKCPHCHCTEHFNFGEIKQFQSDNPPRLDEPGRKLAGIPQSGQNGVLAKFYGVGHCPRSNCGGPILAWFETNNFATRSNGSFQSTHDWIYSGPTPKILGVWPTPSTPEDSENWPEKLRTVFREVQEDAALKRDAARIVGTCRSVLEVALSSLGYGKSQGKNLSDRIDAARSDGLLTESMKQWAHKTRMDGNDALHELNATLDEAVELVNFIRTFLEVSFDLPERIKSLSVDDKTP